MLFTRLICLWQLHPRKEGVHGLCCSFPLLPAEQCWGSQEPAWNVQLHMCQQKKPMSPPVCPHLQTNPPPQLCASLPEGRALTQTGSHPRGTEKGLTPTRLPQELQWCPTNVQPLLLSHLPSTLLPPGWHRLRDADQLSKVLLGRPAVLRLPLDLDCPGNRWQILRQPL